MKKLVAILAGLVCGVLVLFCGCGPVDDSGELPDTGNGSNTTDEIKIPERPEDTNLEFWIVDDVKGYDWSEYEEKFGWFGAREYYGKGYHSVDQGLSPGDDDYQQIDPDHCVKYLLSAWPDYADGGSYITEITITDPTVTVYGLTVNSTFEEFDAVFMEMGYVIDVDDVGDADEDTAIHFASIKGFCFSLFDWYLDRYNGDELEIYHERKIVISAYISNREGIMF